MYFENCIFTGHEHEYMRTIHKKALFNLEMCKEQEYAILTCTNKVQHVKV
jgi:hypothetical protein